MKRNFTKKMLAVALAVALILGCCSLSALAKDANVTYSGNAGDMIFEPGSEYSPTDLFPNFKDVMPGDSLTQKITVTNKADNSVKVKIYLRSLGSTDEAFNEFLNQLTLTVTEDKDTLLFDAPADKTAGLTDWVCLGAIYAGGSVDLNVTLDVPVTLDNMFQEQIGKIKWQFVTEEIPVEDPKWVCPTNPNHKYHIEEVNGVSTFVCDECGQKQPLKCEICGGNMREVATIEIGGQTYTVYADGANHYKTADGKVHFYLNDKGIIEYYTVDGKKIEVKDVSEYKFYRYYECLNEKQHHTEPQPQTNPKGKAPQTGDDSPLWLWLATAAVAAVLLIYLLIAKRKKRNDEDEEGTK